MAKQSVSPSPSLTSLTKKVLIKKCHLCGHVAESHCEIMRCPNCKKTFVPINYFHKVPKNSFPSDYDGLFMAAEEIVEEDLIKGIQVLW